MSDIIISDDIDEFKKLVHEKGIKNINDSHTKYPAHFTCERNAVKILDYLINHKFMSPLELDDNDKTFIHSAAFAGNNQALSLILSSNAGIYLESTNKGGETVFYEAVKYGHLAAAKTLISGGANVNPRNWKESGATPLCLAAQNNNLDMIQLLLDSDAKIECGTFDRITPLCFAGRNGNLEAAQFLHSKGAVMNHKSTFGDSPLSLASRNGNPLTK